MWYRVIRGSRRMLKKIVQLILIILALFGLTACLIVPITEEPQFYPTIEQAFSAHAGVDRRTRMGEILFIDEDDNSVTAFHPGRGWSVSHYIKERRDDGYWYQAIRVADGANILIKFDHVSIEHSQEVIHAYFSKDGVSAETVSRLYERIGRRPLDGYSHDPIIHNLSINGIPVEHVIETTNAQGNPLFFWYYSDFPLIEGGPEDIIISFD